MNVEYYYCNHCGYEDFDVIVVYSRRTASGEYYHCPRCGQENGVEEICDE